MKLNDTNAIDELADNILDYFNIQDYKDIITFALEDIDMSDDISASKSRIDLDHYPYLVQPLRNATIQHGIRKQIVCCFFDQAGKSTIEYIATLYAACYNTLQAIILYPSLDLAMQMNQVRFIPLFRKIRMFQQELDKPFAIRSDRLKLSNACIWFDGGGKKCIGKSAKLVLGDECSQWECPNINNINELKKRTRSYDECLQLFVSTPSYKENPFWQEFLSCSQAYYTLRCNGCGQLTMRSCDLHNLQFESFFNEQMKLYQVKPGTCRLICPKCGYEHVEAQRQDIIKHGVYVHKYPDKAKAYQLSYQAGVLASLQNIHNWDTIADVILQSGKTASLQEYLNLDNSYKALPLQQRNYNKQDETALASHYYKPQELKKEDIQAIAVSADTQGTFSVYSVMALTRDNNFYVLQAGRVRFLYLDDEQRKVIDMENKRNDKSPELTLLDILNREYMGIKPICLLVDEGGNRSEQVKAFSRIQKNILMYKGTSLKFDNWKVSDNNPKLFLCDFKKSLAQFIFMLHYQKNKQSNYLFLPQMTQQDIAQILSFQPDKQKRNGNLFENWTPENRVHDMADTIRMGLMAFKIASKIFKKQRFIHGQAKMLNYNKNPMHKKEKHKPLMQFKNKPVKNIFNRGIY